MAGTRKLRSRNRKSRYGYSWVEVPSEALGQETILRGKLIESRIPGWVSPDLRVMLPDELFWPNTDIGAAHLMIDNILAMHVEDLTSLTRAFPDHTFGFEERYLPWALAQTYPSDPDLAARVHQILPLERDIAKKDLMVTRRIRQGKDVYLDFYVARFKQGDCWGIAIFRTSFAILTKAWVDLTSNRAYVYTHHKGRWRAVSLPESIVGEILGSSCWNT